MNEFDKEQETILSGRLETAISSYKEFEYDLVKLFVGKWPNYKIAFMKVAMDSGMDASKL